MECLISGPYCNYALLEHELSEYIPSGFESLFAEHFHTDYEMLLVVSGSGYYTVSGIKYAIKPYDLFLVPPGRHHYIEITPGTHTYRRSIINFRQDIICSPNMQRALWALPTVINIGGTRLMDEFTRLDGLMHSVDERFRPMAAQGQLEVILSILCSDVFHEEPALYVNPELEKILTLIDENACSLVNLDDLCDRTGKSAYSLKKLFIKDMHISPEAYIKSRKCHIAKELIEQGTPAKVVYRQCGYTTYSTFYRDYVKIFGCSPKGIKQDQQIKENSVTVNEGNVTAFRKPVSETDRK